MKNNLFKLSMLFVLAIIFALSACKKDDADSQSAEDAARNNFLMGDAFALANEGQGEKSLKGFSQGCDTIILFDGGFYIIFTECTGDDGIYRDGTLKVTAADESWTPEGSGGISIEYIDYTHNVYGLSGKITAVVGYGDILGTGKEYLYFTLGADNLEVTHPDNTVAKLNYAELNYVLKVFVGIEIFGNSRGTNRLGVNYSTVSENLEFGTFGSPCPWPTKGTITITIEGEKDIIVNFDQDGTASCDKIFLVSQKRHKDVTATFD